MAQISLRVDDDVKRGAEQTLADIGLSMSTAINVFLRKVAIKTSPFLTYHSITQQGAKYKQNNIQLLFTNHPRPEPPPGSH